MYQQKDVLLVLRENFFFTVCAFKSNNFTLKRIKQVTHKYEEKLSGSFSKNYSIKIICMCVCNKEKP